MPHLFEPLTLRGLTLKNRIMMSPMCQYCGGDDALADDWHLIHYGSRAVGGTGLVMLESTSVESRGRGSVGHLGIFEERHVAPLARVAAACHRFGAKVGIQLGHSGRKARGATKGHHPDGIVSASPIPWDEGWAVPHPLSIAEIGEVVSAFRTGATRALDAGFDVVEIHGAHGYLVNQFLSPLTNHREDEYGGSLENRMRMPLQVVDAVRAVWPERLPLFVRVSATDWAPGGIDVEEMVQIATVFRTHGVDLVACSSGLVVPNESVPMGAGYQVPLAQRIREGAGIPTGAVGLITTPEMADEIIRNGRADLVVLGRELLRNPYWPLQAAAALGAEVEWPSQYRRAKRG